MILSINRIVIFLIFFVSAQSQPVNYTQDSDNFINEEDADTEIQALVDYESGIILYKDESIPACIVQRISESLLENLTDLPALKIHVSEDNAGVSDQELQVENNAPKSKVAHAFCNELPFVRMDHFEDQAPIRKRRQANTYYGNSVPLGEARAQTNRNAPGQASQAQVQGQVFGRGYFSGQAQSQNGGLSQSQVQLAGTGISGQISSSSGNAQAQLALGSGTGSGQASGLGEGPSNSQVQVTLGEEAMASASATSGGSSAVIGNVPRGGFPAGAGSGFTQGSQLHDGYGIAGESGIRYPGSHGFPQGQGVGSGYGPQQGSQTGDTQRVHGGTITRPGNSYGRSSSGFENGERSGSQYGSPHSRPVNGYGLPASGSVNGYEISGSGTVRGYGSPGSGSVNGHGVPGPGVANGYGGHVSALPATHGGHVSALPTTHGGHGTGPVTGAGSPVIYNGQSTPPIHPANGVRGSGIYPTNGIGRPGTGQSTRYGHDGALSGTNGIHGAVESGIPGPQVPTTTTSHSQGSPLAGTGTNGRQDYSSQAPYSVQGLLPSVHENGASRIYSGNLPSSSGTSDTRDSPVYRANGFGPSASQQGYRNGHIAHGGPYAQSSTPGAYASSYGVGQAQAQTVYFGNAGNGQYVPLRYDQSSHPNDQGPSRFQDQQVGYGNAGQRQQVGTPSRSTNGISYTRNGAHDTNGGSTHTFNGGTRANGFGTGLTDTQTLTGDQRVNGGQRANGYHQGIQPDLSGQTTSVDSTQSHGHGPAEPGFDGISSGTPANGGSSHQTFTRTTPPPRSESTGYTNGASRGHSQLSNGYQSGHVGQTGQNGRRYTNGRSDQQSYRTNGFNQSPTTHVHALPSSTGNGRSYGVNGHGQQDHHQSRQQQTRPVSGSGNGGAAQEGDDHDGFSPSYGVAKDDPDGKKQCTIITFSCTIVIESNGRAKICRPNAVKMGNNGNGHRGTNGSNGSANSKICCC